MINRLCIIGVGLIGGSLARALKAKGACHEVIGYSRHVGHLQRAVELGVIDRYEQTVADAIRNADVIVIAVPVGAFDTVFAEIAGAASSGAIITDVGSTKESVIRSAAVHLQHHLARFVPGHPIAGSEKAGVEASDAGLFAHAKVVLTPTAGTDRGAVKIVRDMWTNAGADVVEMDAREHDRILAATSHLPHVLAFALVDLLAQMDGKTDVFSYAGSGFRDFTRIASGDPQMWHDICLANRDAVVAVIESYRASLEKLGQAIEQEDSRFIASMFTRAKQTRDRFK
ncbi:MAG: Prephenate dehydrogenase [Gammaproteobacteria bacterium]|nr:MAG: Prephenate dehydrogenase [Gammaproteobacteria bacterium]TND07050.1 MAG: Prephenate dehydrogenase [Gammaproteobacteria bacterium]